MSWHNKLAIYIALIALLIPFCDYAQANPYVDLVKEGQLSFDNTTTVSGALDNYDYFKRTDWKFLQDKQKRKIVEFSGTFDLIKIANKSINDEFIYNTSGRGGLLPTGYQAKMQSCLRDSNCFLHNLQYDMIVQFLITNDNNFEVGYVGYQIDKRIDKRSIDGIDDVRNVYKNKNYAATWPAVLLYEYESKRFIPENLAANIANKYASHGKKESVGKSFNDIIIDEQFFAKERSSGESVTGMVTRYKDGKKMREFFFDSGVLQKTISYGPNGKVTWETPYKKGSRDGDVLGYHDDGRVKWRIRYVGGLAEGPRIEFYDSGEIKSITENKAGKHDGSFVEFYKDRSIKYAEEYKDGKIVDKRTSYEQGKLFPTDDVLVRLRTLSEWHKAASQVSKTEMPTEQRADGEAKPLEQMSIEVKKRNEQHARRIKEMEIDSKEATILANRRAEQRAKKETYRQGIVENQKKEILTCSAAGAEGTPKGPSLFKEYYYGQTKVALLGKDGIRKDKDEYGEEFLAIDNVDFAGRQWTVSLFFTAKDTLRSAVLTPMQEIEDSYSAAMNTLTDSGYMAILATTTTASVDLVAMAENKNSEKEIEAEFIRVFNLADEQEELSITFIPERIFQRMKGSALTAEHLIATMPSDSRCAVMYIYGEENGIEGHITFAYPSREADEAMKRAGGGKEIF